MNDYFWYAGGYCFATCVYVSWQLALVTALIFVLLYGAWYYASRFVTRIYRSLRS